MATAERLERLAESAHLVALRPRPDSPSGYGYPKAWPTVPSSLSAVVSGWQSVGALGLVVPEPVAVIDADRRCSGGAPTPADVSGLVDALGEPSGWYWSKGPHRGAHVIYSRAGFDPRAGRQWSCAGLAGDVKASGLVHVRSLDAVSVWCSVLESGPRRCLDWPMLGQYRGAGGSTGLDHSPKRQRLRALKGRTVKHGRSFERDLVVVEALLFGQSERAAATGLGIGREVVRTVKRRIRSGACSCGACVKLRAAAG